MFFIISLHFVCPFLEDVKRLNEKLAAANTAKIELQLQLDELQTSAFSVKVSTGILVHAHIFCTIVEIR